MKKKEVVKRRKLLLHRVDYGCGYTGGRLYLDGSFVCGTLEGPFALLTEGTSVGRIAQVASSRNRFALPSGVYVCRPWFSSSSSPSRCSMEVVGGRKGVANFALVTGNTVRDAWMCAIVLGRVSGSAVYKSAEAMGTLAALLHGEEEVIFTVV